MTNVFIGARHKAAPGKRDSGLRPVRSCRPSALSKRQPEAIVLAIHPPTILFWQRN